MQGIIPFAVAVVLTLSAQPATAQSATIQRDAPCGGLVPNADGTLSTNYIETTDTKVVTKGNTTTLSCHFNVPSELRPQTTTRAIGLDCYTYLGFTTDSLMQANPGGNATLSCRIRR